ncbi:MAG: hypothetical protein EXS58_04515 [Candidatus Latescibacteria bacterium]|nr:hypothetical protein [Candidatus Latescibacterota bacterium]
MAEQPPAVVELGNRRELFVDHLLIDALDGVRLKLHEPRPAEVALCADQPWDGPFNAGHCVLHDQGLFRMYYRALQVDGPVCLCYAESEDGISWRRPALDLVRDEQGRPTNILLRDTPNFDLFLDTCPGTPADERIKLVQYFSGRHSLTPYDAGKGGKQVYLSGSGDGIHFRRLAEEPVLHCDLPNAFDSSNVFFWSAAEGQYVGYFRFMDDWRSVARITSPDLRRWSAPEPMTYGDTPREHLYTNATTPYFRAPHLYLALPARFLPDRRVVSDEELAGLQVATAQGHVYYNDCSEAVLMSTRAGTACYQRTFLEGFVRPGPGAGNWVSRTNYPLTGIVQTGPEELSFYVSREYAQPTWHIRRYTLRLDGFVSVNAPYGGGELCTRLLRFAGSRLELNYATGAAGQVRVEVQDETGRPLPGLGLEDCDPLIGDHCARQVCWRGSPQLPPLTGKAVRLRFSLQDADLYSLRFC